MSTIISCSTPCGVTVGFTEGVIGYDAHRRLLNALRRHGRVHARAAVRPLAHWTAQRLAASRSGSPVLGDAQQARDRLLNALRRHGRVHAELAARLALRLGLLNALRRHGRVHAGARRSAAAPLDCSTPCGVTVGFTPQVLRAAVRPPGALDCSTPCGVTVGFTSAWGRPAARDRLLNALRRHGRVHAELAARLALRLGLLNALRRHGRVHAGARRSAAAPLDCSTPCGVTVGFTPQVLRRVVVPVLCSTPCGVTVGFT